MSITRAIKNETSSTTLPHNCLTQLRPKMINATSIRLPISLSLNSICSVTKIIDNSLSFDSTT